MLPSPVTAPERAVLHFPDRSTTWAILLCADLAEAINEDTLVSHLRSLQEAAPITGARLQGSTWVAGPELGFTVARTPQDLLASFDLAHEPPLRVAHWGSKIALSGHHAAFDGLALAAALGSLLGVSFDSGPPTVAGRGGDDTLVQSSRSALSTLLSPACRVAPSASVGSEVRIARPIGPRPRMTAAIADAAARAVVARNHGLGEAIGPLGITIGVGGTRAISNDASYRRVNVRNPAAVAPAVLTALASSATPGLFRLPGPVLRMLAPIAMRFSDTFLVSNLGRLELPGVSRLEFYPVARGRSAVAFGAAGVAGGTSTLTIRARDLDQADAERLLDDVIRRLSED